MTYIFDMDGTLIDSMPTFTSAIIGYLDSIGADYPEDVIKIVTPLGLAGTVKYIKNELGVNITEQSILTSLGEKMLDAYLNKIPAKPYVKDKLLSLNSEGHTLAVLTASPHITVDPCLLRLGLTPFFRNIWSCDDFGRTKEDPRIYTEAAERLGVLPEECIFVDDNVNALYAANLAGMQTYGIYDEASAEFEQEMRKVAKRYILDFSEL